MDYEKFKASILRMTGIDLSAYKENQMKRRINTLIDKHKIAAMVKTRIEVFPDITDHIDFFEKLKYLLEGVGQQ